MHMYIVHVYHYHLSLGPLSIKSLTTRTNILPHSMKVWDIWSLLRGDSQQVNFLVDESFLTGKGANTVISIVHYYLEHHGVHSAIVHFNADKCVGQNKNNPMIWVSKTTNKHDTNMKDNNNYSHTCSFIF